MKKKKKIWTSHIYSIYINLECSERSMHLILFITCKREHIDRKKFDESVD